MKILSKLIEYGLIQELNDWQTHFLAGTKGMPKTDPIIIDYVKALLEEVYPNQPEKVRNCRLAPWLISVVKGIGPENIDTAQRNKMLDVANWFKTTGTEGPFKNKDLNAAHEFVISKKAKETREEPREEEESGPYLQAEKDGRIRKIGSVGDGRIWVEVLDNTWLGEESELNPHHKWGINCQSTPAHGFWSNDMLNVQLIGPPNGNPKGKWSTQIAMAGPKGSGDIKEIKQEGNQQPGSQRTSGGYSDGAEVIVNFLCSNPFAKQNFKRFILYNGGVPRTVGTNTYGGDTFLIYLSKPKTADLFNKLMDCREDILENNRDLIIALKGLDWFEERNMDVNDLAERDPEGFLRKFDRLYTRWGDVAVESLKKIDFNRILNDNKELFKSALPSLIGRIPANDFITLFSMIDTKEFMASDPENFKTIVKFMSNEKQYKDVLEKIYNIDPSYFFSVFGKSTMGVIKFLSFASTPRLREHQDAIWDENKEQYYVNKKAYKKNPDGSIMRDATGNRIVDHIYKAWIPENLLVMDKKERRKIIEKNKDFIESLVKGNDFEKRISYLKILLPQLSEQDAKKMLESNNLKDQIIKYYDDKYQQFKQDQEKGEEYVAAKYGRRLQGATSTQLVQNFEPGILEFYRQFRIGGPESRKIPTSEIMANFNKVKNYYAENSMKADEPNKPKEEKGILSWKQKHQMIGFAQALELLKKSGLSEEEIIKIINSSAKKSNFTSPAMMKVFFSNVLPVLKKSNAISEAQKLKTIFEKIGGEEYYKDLIKTLSIITFRVSPGDRIMFKGNEGFRQKLNLTEGKKYLVIEVRNTFKKDLPEDQINNIDNIEAINSEVLVTEDDMGQGYGGQNIWVSTDRFDVKFEYRLISEKLNESFRTFSEKLNRLRVTLNESEGEKKPRYTAIMLDDNSMQRLEQFIKDLKSDGIVGEDWKISADHVTMNMAGIKNATLLGQQVNVTAVAIGSDDKVVALKVNVDKNLDFQGRVPHVTLAFNKNAGGKPVMSNQLKDWKNITPINLKGTIEEVY